MNQKKMKCKSCQNLSAIVKRVCRNCIQFKQGYRSVIYCQKCHQTLFSVLVPREVCNNG